MKDASRPWASFADQSIIAIWNTQLAESQFCRNFIVVVRFLGVVIYVVVWYEERKARQRRSTWLVRFCLPTSVIDQMANLEWKFWKIRKEVSCTTRLSNLMFALLYRPRLGEGFCTNPFQLWVLDKLFAFLLLSASLCILNPLRWPVAKGNFDSRSKSWLAVGNELPCHTPTRTNKSI